MGIGEEGSPEYGGMFEGGYAVDTEKTPDGSWEASSKKFPGSVGRGDSQVEAMHDLTVKVARRIESSSEAGLGVPMPDVQVPEEILRMIQAESGVHPGHPLVPDEVFGDSEPEMLEGGIYSFCTHMARHMSQALEAAEEGRGREVLAHLASLHQELTQMLPQLAERRNDFSSWEEFGESLAEDWENEKELEQEEGEEDV